MFTSYRIHQEQLRHLNDYLNTIYSRRIDEQEEDTEKRDLVSWNLKKTEMESDIQPVTFRHTAKHDGLTPMASSRRNLPGKEGRNNSVYRCRWCGEPFPLLDFYYTKKTGLCILCWEDSVI